MQTGPTSVLQIITGITPVRVITSGSPLHAKCARPHLNLMDRCQLDWNSAHVGSGDGRCADAGSLPQVRK